MTATTDHLAAVRTALDLAGKATRGPYTASDYNPQVMGPDGQRVAWIGTDGPGDRESPGANRQQLRANARAIASLHNAIGDIAAVCDELERMQLVDDAMLKEAGRLSAKLREAKRLGLEACDAAREAESRADHERDGRLTSPRTSAAIRAALEAL